MIDDLFYFPVTLHRDTTAGALSMPWVTQLPPVQEVIDSVYVLTKDEGIGQGVYVWDGSRFRVALPYPDICQAVIGAATVNIYYDVNTPAALPTKSLVWRNGIPYSDPNFTVGDGAVWAVLTYPLSAAGDVKTVNGQHPDATGNVTVSAVDANDASGTTLIVDSGALTGSIKLKTIVAGSGITLANDSNGNLQISGANQYVLPAATTTTLGGVIVAGPGLAVNGSGAIGATYATPTQAGIAYAPVGSGINTAAGGVLSLLPPTGGVIGGVKAGANVAIAADGTISVAAPTPPYTLPAATASSLGGVKIGANVSVTADGTISVAAPTPPYTLPAATASTLGGVTIGANVNVTADGTISVAAPYVLPVATVSVLGGVKQGANVTIAADGTISASGAVQSVSGQTGAVVISTVNNNGATGTTLITDSGATTGTAKLKTLVAGTLIQFATDANGNLVINSTATGGALTAVNNEGTGTGLVDNNGTAGGIATIRSIAAGSNVTITPSGDNKTLTIAANQVLNPATTTTIGGVIIGAGLNVDGTGKITLAAPTGVNLGGVKAGTGISIAADGTISATGAVASVSGQTGAVVVQATNNNGATGTSLISDSGATTANIKLKTIVAGSGITLSADPNGNLQIASTATGGVSSITAGTSGALTGAITFTAGPSISLSNTGNSVQISGTGVPEAPNDGNGYMRQNLAWAVVPSIANAITSVTGQTGTGAVLLVESNPPANSAIIKSLVAGQNVTLSEAGGLITITAAIPAGTVSTVNGISPNGSGNVTLTAANVNAVPIAGNVTMTGPLNFGSQVVNGVPTPANPSDAVPLSFLQNLTIDGGVIG